MACGQDVIIRAEAGTGKTFGLQQLALLLATELQASEDAVPLVPLLIPVQRLAVLMRQTGRGREEQADDLLAFFINAQFEGADRDLLLQAYEMRALVPLIDGVDEGADLKQTIETFITDKLAPLGVHTGIHMRNAMSHRHKSPSLCLTMSPLGWRQW